LKKFKNFEMKEKYLRKKYFMKLLKIQKSFKIFTDLNFALLILGIIAVSSSLGSFIEQDEGINFYEENYKIPIYGFIPMPKNMVVSFILTSMAWMNATSLRQLDYMVKT